MVVTSKPTLTPLRRIPTPKGDVFHGMKASDFGFAGFGEAYFSTIHAGDIKGWKRHSRMTLNIICVYGAIRFVVHDGRQPTDTWLDVVLSPDTPERYQRLTVPPMLWVGFQGVGKAYNLLVNIANLEHDPAEASNVELSSFAWPEASACYETTLS